MHAELANSLVLIMCWSWVPWYGLIWLWWKTITNCMYDVKITSVSCLYYMRVRIVTDNNNAIFYSLIHWISNIVVLSVVLSRQLLPPFYLVLWECTNLIFDIRCGNTTILRHIHQTFTDSNEFWRRLSKQQLLFQPTHCIITPTIVVKLIWR